ncbi:hypothetical protein M1545_02950 [Patescibacteria group bacterium]|nr:hypothetical protein [Patescibacteria group bacterium]
MTWKSPRFLVGFTIELIGAWGVLSNLHTPGQLRWWPVLVVGVLIAAPLNLGKPKISRFEEWLEELKRLEEIHKKKFYKPE